MLYETHLHTPLCRHAWGRPEEYARVAVRRGLRGIIVTCHNPMPDGYAQDSRMYADQWPQYLDLVAEARSAMAGVADVRLGLECDYAPGFEAFLARQIASAPLHYVLGSVHPHVGEYRQRYFRGDMVAYQKTYFEHLAMAAETRLFDALSHPDIIKIIEPSTWQLPRVLDDIRRALDRIAATGVAMELNTSGVHKELPEMNPGPVILREMAARGIPVVIGADAHEPARVAEGFVTAMDELEQAGHRTVNWFLERQRHTASLDEARASLLAAEEPAAALHSPPGALP